METERICGQRESIIELDALISIALAMSASGIRPHSR